MAIEEVSLCEAQARISLTEKQLRYHSWFGIPPFLDALNQKKLLYVCELKSQ